MTTVFCPFWDDGRCVEGMVCNSPCEWRQEADQTNTETVPDSEMREVEPYDCNNCPYYYEEVGCTCACGCAWADDAPEE